MGIDAKFAHFSIAGAAGGVLASLGYEVWERGPEQREAIWGFGSMMVSATYVVAVGLLATFVSLALVVAQSRYLGQGWFPPKLWRAVGTALLGGILGGFLAPYFAAHVFDTTDPIRFLGWTLAGASVGLVVSYAVVNLPAPAAIIGGAAGGFVGCSVLYLMGQDLTMGFGATGLAIGLLVAVAERVKRTAWVEVTIAQEGEQARTIELSVGEQPITFGYDKQSDVRLEAVSGAPAGAYAVVKQEQGRVVYQDLIRRSDHVMTDGSTFTVSNGVVRLKGK